MAIQDKHLLYDKYAESWDRCRTVYEGQEEVKKAEEDFLPRIGDMTDTQYDDYVMRAMFYNATYRTIEGMVGLAAKNEPTKTLPENTEVFSENVDHKNTDINSYVEELIREALIVGHGGTLIDFPVAPDNITKAEAEALNLSPIWAHYKAEHIYNWRFSLINNQYQLSYMTLYEAVEVEGKTLFDTETEIQFRVLHLTEEGVYQQDLYTVVNEDSEPVLKESVQPKMNNETMNYIPFVFHSQSDKTTVKRPPLADLVDVNVKHYQLKADQYHGMHFSALPTPWMTGVDADDGAPSEIGSQKMWILSNPDAKVGMLEFKGTGMNSFETECASLQNQMSTLGARMLSPDKSTQETATAAEIRTTGETSTLATIVKNINRQVTRMLDITAEWMAEESDEIDFTLPTNFIPYRLDGEGVLKLVDAWTGGAISKETMFDNLQRSDIISDGTTFEEEEEKIINDSNILRDEQNAFDEGDAVDDDNDE